MKKVDYSKMRVNYYDFGLYKGVETKWMIDKIFPSLGITNYHIYGFEACTKYANKLKERYEENSRVTIINKAIIDENRATKLYYANNQVGHSVFSTKRNVTRSYEEVQGIKFSEWLKENVESYEKDFNIIKVNIEGAEWYLFNDLVRSGVHKSINFYCGQGHDVNKVAELENKTAAYYQLLEENNIHLYRFSEWNPHKNDDVAFLIKEKMEKENNG